MYVSLPFVNVNFLTGAACIQAGLAAESHPAETRHAVHPSDLWGSSRIGWNNSWQSHLSGEVQRFQPSFISFEFHITFDVYKILLKLVTSSFNHISNSSIDIISEFL